MAELWESVAQIVSAAAAKYSKDVENATVRGSLPLAMLERRNRIRLGVDGSYETEYPIDYKEPTVSPIGYTDGATYTAQDYLTRAKINWRSLVATDAMHIMEYDQLAHSAHNLVNRYKRILPKLMAGVRSYISQTALFVDGGAQGNTKKMCGLETFLGAKAASTLATDIVAPPDDTYNQVDTDLASGTSSWSTDLGEGNYPNADIASDWPEGKGTTDYDYWSPKLVNWSSSKWGTEQTTWLANCEQVLRRTGSWIRMTTGAEAATLLTMLPGHMYADFCAAMSTKGIIMLPHKESNDLGFPDALNFEGQSVKSYFGVPANTGYVLNIDTVELLFLTKKMIETHGPDWDPDTLTYKFAVHSSGNFKFSPKHAAKLYNYA